MFENEDGKYPGKYFLIVITTITLVSFSGLTHNAFAMGPSSCYNQYNAPFVSFIVNNGSQTFDPLANPGVTFNVNTNSDYNVTFVMHTPSISSWNNTNLGTVWYEDEISGYFNSHCISPVGPNQNITITGIGANPHAGGIYTQSVVFGTAASSAAIFNVNWVASSHASTSTVPSLPQNLQATAGNAQVTLSWMVPASNGGSPITNYKVYRGTSSGNETLLAATGNVTSYNDTMVTNGQTYFYKVTAVNSVGESSPSNEASATPTAPASTSGDKVIATIPVGNHPVDIAVNQVTNKIYVANEENQSSVIDGATNSVVANLPVQQLSTVAVNPNTNMIYGTMGPQFYAINGSTNQVVSTLQLTGFIAVDLKVNPNTNKVYVTEGGYAGHPVGYVEVINGTTNTIQKTITVTGASGLAINPVTNKVYLSYGTISIIDGTTDTVTGSISGATTAGSMAINPITNRLYATSNSYGTMSIADLTTNSVLGTIHIGTSAGQVAVNPNTDKIYVGLTDYPTGNDITVINGSTNTILENITAGKLPGAVAVNPSTDKIYVSNTGDNTVTVIDGNSPTIPQSPTGLTATPKMPPQIDLSWTAPSNNGGSAVTGYMIERSTDDGTTWSTIVQNTGNTKTAYTDSHLMPVKTYTYRVSAINGIGTSDPSNTASARPLSAHGH